MANTENSSLSHILAIIEERVYLYRKRQLEIKRSLKAHHRGEVLPSSIVTKNLLEAVINYAINFAAYESLKTLNSQTLTNEVILNKRDSLCKQVEFVQPFETNLLKLKIFKKLELTSKDITIFCKIVFSLDEEYQRKTIASFVKERLDILIDFILTEIAIFDNSYKNKMIKEYTKKQT